MNRILIAALISLLPVAALSSGGHADDLFAEKLGIQIADFLVVIVPLMLILVPLIRRSLKKRYDQVEKMLQESRTKFDEAEKRLAAAEECMRHIDSEMVSIRQSFLDMGESEKKSYQAEALASIQKMQHEAEMRMNQAGLAMQARITDDLIARALEKVESRLADQAGKPLTDELTGRLTDQRN